jgi:hypothetical protein
MDNNSENSDKVFGEKFQKALQAINYLSSLNLPSSSSKTYSTVIAHAVYRFYQQQIAE